MRELATETGVNLEELVEDLALTLKHLGDIQLELLPGIDENIRFRMPSEPADARYAEAGS